MKRILSLFLALWLFACPICAFALDEAPVQQDRLTAAKAALREGLDQVKDRIDLSAFQLSDAELGEIFQNLMSTSAELFYVDSSYSYSYSSAGIVAFIPVYLYDSDEIAQMRGTFEDLLDRILSKADPDWTDLEKVLFINDYLCANFRYDTSLAIHDAYRFLTQRKGVCQAYSLTAIALLERLGVEAGAAQSDPMNHLWLLVKVDGVWYHLDVTWDDPIEDRFGMAYHGNFLRSDAGIASTGHYAWTCINAPDTLSDTRYDQAYYQQTESPFAYLDGHWYFIRPQSGGAGFGLYRDDPDGGTLLQTFTDVWTVLDQPGYFYTTPYTGLFAHDGLLWFNTPNAIRTYDPNTGATQTVLQYAGTSGLIYGVQNGLDGIRYATDTAPGTGAYSVFTFYRSDRTVERADDEIYAFDQNEHWLCCAVCGASVADSRETHSFGDWNTIEQDGVSYRKKTCSVCGYEYAERLVVPESFGPELWTTGSTSGILCELPAGYTITRAAVDFASLTGTDFALSENPCVGTLTPAFLETLGEGEYTLELTATDPDGNPCAAIVDFVIERAQIPEPALIIGDVDGDGEIGLSDLTLLAKAVAGWELGDPYRAACADCDGDGNVELNDIVILAKFIAGWSVILGV